LSHQESEYDVFIQKLSVFHCSLKQISFSFLGDDIMTWWTNLLTFQRT